MKYSFSPTAEPVIFLHGLWGNKNQWDPWLTAFPERASYALDLASHGERFGMLNGLSLCDYARDVEEKIGSFHQPVILVGHSAGGLIAQMVATNIPKRISRLILLNSGPAKQCGWVPFRSYFCRWWLCQALVDKNGTCTPSEDSVNYFTNGVPMAFGLESNLAVREGMFSKYRVERQLCSVDVICSDADAIIPIHTQQGIAGFFGTRLMILPGSHMFHCDPATRDKAIKQVREIVSRTMQKAA